MSVSRCCHAGLLLLLLVSEPVGIGRAEEPVDFETQILPILEERCLYCHGEDEQESALRLDRRIGMIKGGDSGLSAVVAGDPDKSYLIELITSEDDDIAMPPDDDRVPPEEVDLLRRWIKGGAVLPGQMDEVDEEEVTHWSFLPVRRPAVPEGLIEEVGDPIDAFLLRRLRNDSLEFSKPASASAVIRRVSIVLVGMAPTPEEVDVFEAEFAVDPDQAYSSLVDRLLNSPHFGERWAQHWLDVIRWAETNGSEANLYRKNAWVYRDYVVRAFNQDMPYDQFVREQIAGDSLDAGDATGFLVAGPHVPAATVGREPSAIRQARADRMDEIMQTVGASVMGVTMGCARCHNHKFDPISIKDYYSMTGVFQDVEFGSRFPELAQEHPRRLKGSELRSKINRERRLLSEMGPWEENWGAFRELHFKPYQTRAVRIRFKMANVGLDEIQLFGPNAPRENLALARIGTQVTGDPEMGFEGRNPLNRVNDGQFGTMTWRAKVQKGEDRPWVRFDFTQAVTVDRIRLSSNREYFYDTDYLTKKPNLPRYEYDLDVLQEDGSWQPWTGTWVANTQMNKKHADRPEKIQALQAAIDTLASEGPQPSFVGRFVPPPVTRVLLRGSPENPRDEVAPSGPAVLGGDLGLDQSASGAERRLQFARWISSPDNPLTSRVMVNRIWHHVFGRGIVPTTSDFGSAGAPPSHPELLDWIAADFVDPQRNGNEPWSMKSLIRTLVMTRAFRQSSAPDERALKVDASSMLLWRFPPKRVEAEVIRDSILQASGALDPAVGGKSYRIHNEKKTYAQWEVIDNHSEPTWRRMIYQERMRRVDDQIFTAFDFPDCGQVRARRPVSTTPLQALNLMNSPFVMEQSEMIAQRSQEESGEEIRASVVRCFELLLTRQPTEGELEACIAVADRDGLFVVCRTLINTNEFAFLP